MAGEIIGPVLLTTKEAAAYLSTKSGYGISEATLVTWRSRGRPDGPAPSFRKLSAKCVVYAIEDLNEYIEQCKQSAPGNEFTTRKPK